MTKGFGKFVKSEKIPETLLREAIERANTGLIDAILKGEIIKQRIPRKNEGRSGGYRTIIAYRKGDKAFFLYGFSKNEADNIDDDDLKDLMEYGKILFSFSDKELEIALSNKQLKELKYDKKI